MFVGVSAGAFLGALLANGVSTRDLVRAVAETETRDHPFRASIFFTPAFGRWAAGGLRLPGRVLDALAEIARSPREGTAWTLIDHLGRALPTALFNGEPIREALASILSAPDRTDDFRRLPRPLFVVATDLDSGRSIRFGEQGFDHVPISRAVQASSALPGLYPPVEIDGRHYVDGILQKTMHASTALDRDVDLLLCLNPIVPVDTEGAFKEGFAESGGLAGQGLPLVLSQTFRALIHSRLEAGLANYEPRFPEQEVLVFEPTRDDHRMFFTNIFRFSTRRDVCEHAYSTMRAQLRERRDKIGPLLERHGLALDEDVLADLDRSPFGAPTDRARPDTDENAGSAHDRLNALLVRLEDRLDGA